MSPILRSGGSSSGTVTSVTAADTSIVVGGTPAAPTIATGTLDVIAADHPPAASVPMNGQKHSGLAAGTVNGDSVRFEQLALAQIAAGTNHTLALSGASVMGSLAAGASGQRLVSQGAAADPVWQTAGWSAGVSLLNTNTAQTVISQSIPGGTLPGVNGGLLCIVAGRYFQNSGAGRGLTLQISYGGTTLWGDASTATYFAASANPYPFYLEFVLTNVGGTSSQAGAGILCIGPNSAASIGGQGNIVNSSLNTFSGISGSSAVDSTAAQTFLIQATNTASNALLGFVGTTHLLPLI